MYIGLTMQSAKRRFSDHLSSALNPNSKDHNQAIHKAIRKYGIGNFDFIILEDNIDSLQKCKEREIYWIKHYNTYENREHYNETPGGDCPGYGQVHKGKDHHNAALTEEEVIYCRKCYREGKRSKDIYNELNVGDRINYRGFQKMWHGITWKHVMPEVFQINPHRGSYGAKDRDIITARYKESGLSLNKFVRTPECYVGYGTLWTMIRNPKFYDGK